MNQKDIIIAQLGKKIRETKEFGRMIPIVNNPNYESQLTVYSKQIPEVCYHIRFVYGESLTVNLYKDGKVVKNHKELIDSPNFFKFEGEKQTMKDLIKEYNLNSK